MRKINLSIMRIFLLLHILFFVLSSCVKNPDESVFCDNCDPDTIDFKFIGNKAGWLTYNEEFNKYVIEVIYCTENPIVYIPCQMPDYFHPEEFDTVLFSGTIIKEPFTSTDTIPINYFCTRLDTISLYNNFPDPGTLPQGLKGSWVETTLRIDTIVFTENSNEGHIWLKNCLRYGGIYPYSISQDSIYIIDPSSSESRDSFYYFKFDESKLTINIGCFTYRLSITNSILTFKKIK